MTDWPLVAVRLGVYLSIGTLFGLAAFGMHALRAGERGSSLALRGWLAAMAGTGLVLSACWLVLLSSSMADLPVWSVDQTAIDAVLTSSGIGAAWKVRIIALLIAGASVVRIRWLPLTVLASAVALATLAWTGHGSIDEGTVGWVHLGADLLHLIASAAWMGALLGLVLLVVRPIVRIDTEHLELTHRALHRFGTIGTVVVATLVVTGLVNSWLMVGLDHMATLPSTRYGQLLMAKMALFALMLGLAALNRFWLTPAFEQSIADASHARALRELRVSLAVEVTSIVAILGLVAWLGTLAPPQTAS